MVPVLLLLEEDDSEGSGDDDNGAPEHLVNGGRNHEEGNKHGGRAEEVTSSGNGEPKRVDLGLQVVLLCGNGFRLLWLLHSFALLVKHVAVVDGQQTELTQEHQRSLEERVRELSLLLVLVPVLCRLLVHNL